MISLPRKKVHVVHAKKGEMIMELPTGDVIVIALQGAGPTALIKKRSNGWRTPPLMFGRNEPE